MNASNNQNLNERRFNATEFVLKQWQISAISKTNFPDKNEYFLLQWTHFLSATKRRELFKNMEKWKK